MRFIVITGLSGSGKSTAARVLEDEGFSVIDNFPLALLPQFLQLQQEGGASHQVGVALVMDVRNPQFMDGASTGLAAVKQAGYVLEVYFFDAGDEVLLRRFSETRRRHPLSGSEGLPAALERERRMLQPLRRQATVVFDTSALTVHELRAAVLRQLHGHAERAVPLVVRLESFGFRYGLPLEADLVIDVRFLPNPYYEPQLRPFSGRDAPVREFVLQQPLCRAFVERTRDYLGFLLPHYRQEGKSYLTVAIGCTGGRHRSVALVEELHRCLAEQGTTVRLVHRDLVKEDG